MSRRAGLRRTKDVTQRVGNGSTGFLDGGSEALAIAQGAWRALALASIRCNIQAFIRPQRGNDASHVSTAVGSIPGFVAELPEASIGSDTARRVRIWCSWGALSVSRGYG